MISAAAFGSSPFSRNLFYVCFGSLRLSHIHGHIPPVTICLLSASCAVILCKSFKGNLQQYTIHTEYFNYSQPKKKSLDFTPCYVMMCEGCLSFQGHTSRSLYFIYWLISFIAFKVIIYVLLVYALSKRIKGRSCNCIYSSVVPLKFLYILLWNLVLDICH